MTKQKFNTSVADPGRNRRSTQRRAANSFGHFFYIKMKIGKAEGACAAHPYSPPPRVYYQRTQVLGHFQ